MSFGWTEAVLREKNLIDAPEFDRGYNNLKALVNGGIDRENLPQASIKDDHLGAQPFLKYALAQGIMLQGGVVGVSVPPALSDIYSMTYNTYGGGWVTNEEQYLNEVVQEGMLHIEFCCWFYVNNCAQGAPRRCRFRILVDGEEVARTDGNFKNVGTVFISAQIPTASGTRKIQIGWETSVNQTASSANTNPLFSYGGGSLLLINRYR